MTVKRKRRWPFYLLFALGALAGAALWAYSPSLPAETLKSRYANDASKFIACLSGCHPQPLAVVFGHAHGRSPAWQSSVPTIAARVPATFP